MSTLRILIADDHEMVRRGLKAALSEHAGWEVCGEAANGREAIELAEQLQPNIVILDLTMPELNGLEAIHRIRRALPRTRVLVLTMHDSEQLVREVIAAGAHGYVLKSDAGRVLAEAVQTLGENKSYFTSKIAENVLSGAGSADSPEITEGLTSDRLTPREREVLQLIAEGKTNKEIASVLGISVRTAETHRTNIMNKLNLHSASDITRYAIRNKIIQA